MRPYNANPPNKLCHATTNTVRVSEINLPSRTAMQFQFFGWGNFRLINANKAKAITTNERALRRSHGLSNLNLASFRCNLNN
ncbi:MAG: hypothetical protein RIB93_24215 [Coleofasciculus sp. D1-CHI-01]|uniref:hypothetical protein n=1 Tax=Coleofasciculus sp. D1-CHI-01 TaxID=3068482 RepID=UPI003305193C